MLTYMSEYPRATPEYNLRELVKPSIQLYFRAYPHASSANPSQTIKTQLRQGQGEDIKECQLKVKEVELQQLQMLKC